MKVDGKEYSVEIEELSSGVDNDIENISDKSFVRHEKLEPATKKVERVERPAVASEEKKPVSQSEGNTVSVVSPMSGTILEIFVSVGETVEPGQKLVLLEAMKMENNILAEKSGVVRELKVKKGDNIDAGETMIVLG